MNFAQIVQIVGLVLDALKALEQAGVLKNNSTITPRLETARAVVDDHLAELKQAAQKKGA